MPAYTFGVTLAVASLFVLSGGAKLRAKSFRSDLVDYRLLPRAAVGPVAAVLPWLEISVGSALFAGAFPVVSITSAAALLAIFTVGMAVNLAQGRTINCGCRGARKPISWRLVASNVALLVAVGVAAGSWAAPVLPTLAGTEARLAADEGLAVLFVVTALGVCSRVVDVWMRLKASVGNVERLGPRRGLP